MNNDYICRDLLRNYIHSADSLFKDPKPTQKFGVFNSPWSLCQAWSPLFCAIAAQDTSDPEKIVLIVIFRYVERVILYFTPEHRSDWRRPVGSPASSRKTPWPKGPVVSDGSHSLGCFKAARCGPGSASVERLTHWGRDIMDALSQTTFPNAFSWMKIFQLRLKFHWSLFLRSQLTIFQHLFR